MLLREKADLYLFVYLSIYLSNLLPESEQGQMWCTGERPKNNAPGQHWVPFCQLGSGVGCTSPGHSTCCRAGMKESKEMLCFGKVTGLGHCPVMSHGHTACIHKALSPCPPY